MVSSEACQSAYPSSRLDALPEDGQPVPRRDRRPQGRDRQAREGVAETASQE